MKRIFICQSNYIPWKGFFDALHLADTYVMYDDMQYTRRDWRNRNLIKSPQGLQWLTIPVEVKGKYHQTIEETKVSDPNWAEKHLATLNSHYAKAPHYEEQKKWLIEMYAAVAEEPYLSRINERLLKIICQRLDIGTTFVRSSEMEVKGDKSERLLQLCQALQATHYLSGPAARDYLDCNLFQVENVAVEWMDYSGYPVYPQLYPPFEHGVSVLDLLLSTGNQSNSYMKTFSTSIDAAAQG